MPGRQRPQSNAELHREVARLRARLRRADAAAGGLVREKAAEELRVYQEKSRRQTEQLLETQAALEESRDRYASLYDFAPIGYMTLDSKGVIEEINLVAAGMLGAERSRLLRVPLLAMVDAHDRKPFLRHLLACRTKQTTTSTELRLRPRNGGNAALPVMLRTWTTVSQHDRGEGRGYEFRSAVLDLTERHRAQEQEAVYRERLRSLASELSLAEERERRRIAVEIHDNISQALAMAKMKLDASARMPLDPQVRRTLEAVSGVVDEVLGRTRSLTFELSPPVLHELGFEPALEWLAEQSEHRYGLPVTVDLQSGGKSLPHETAVLLFQAVRELLVNVVKHSEARRAAVRVRRVDGAIRVVVEDDGCGLPVTKSPVEPPGNGASHGGGFGLFSIRTRLEYLGGGIALESKPGDGLRVTLTAPLDGKGPPIIVPARRADGTDSPVDCNPPRPTQRSTLSPIPCTGPGQNSLPLSYLKRSKS
jgi:PAS domain S-box-containing protein